MAIPTHHFAYVRSLVADRASNVISDQERYLVESRLLPVARLHGCSSVVEFLAKVQAGQIEDAPQILVEAMMNEETTFFRDPPLFDALKTQVIPELLRLRAAEHRLTIWCAACSTGQEPYSVAMLLKEYFPQLESWNVKVLATDISGRSLKKGQAGAYNQLDVNRGLPSLLLVKYFQQQNGGWSVKQDLSATIEFRQMNLAETWTGVNDVDLVFLRNVLPYFGEDTKKSVLKKVRRVLKPGGYLFLGEKESGKELAPTFEKINVARAIGYRVSAQAAANLTDKYDLESRAAGAARLARLIESRDDANLGEIVETISTDPELKARLLRAANPNARNGTLSVTNVEEALMKTGSGFLVVLAMGDPLVRALKDTFSTMLSISPEAVDTSMIGTYWQGQMVGTAKFSGKATGRVHIRFKNEFAVALAAQMLGIDPAQTEPSMVTDVVSELVNMIVGNFKSNLSDAGLSCKLDVPEVMQIEQFKLGLSPEARHEQLGFRYQGQPILVDVVVDSMG